jgi:hypothetical protein
MRATEARLLGKPADDCGSTVVPRNRTVELARKAVDSGSRLAAAADRGNAVVGKRSDHKAPDKEQVPGIWPEVGHYTLQTP